MDSEAEGVISTDRAPSGVRRSLLIGATLNLLDHYQCVRNNQAVGIVSRNGVKTGSESYWRVMAESGQCMVSGSARFRWCMPLKRVALNAHAENIYGLAVLTSH